MHQNEKRPRLAGAASISENDFAGSNVFNSPNRPTTQAQDRDLVAAVRRSHAPRTAMADALRRAVERGRP
jgi:hypothetical protein